MKDTKPGEQYQKYQSKKKGRKIIKAKTPKTIVKLVAVRGLV